MGAAGTVAAPASGRVVHALGGESMGTRWQVSLAAAGASDLYPLHAGIQATLERVVAQMSSWESGSDLCRYNRAPAGSWQRLPQPFFDVLRASLRVAEASDGACDPTVAPLVDLWGFGPAGGAGRIPEAAAVAAARARVGWQRVTLDGAGQRALQPGGVALDLSGIAKGHGVDAVAAWLRAQGVRAALVEVGGELYGYGSKPDGNPWRVLVEAWPDEGDDCEALPPCVLALDGRAVATSGDHWHRFAHDGRVFAHSIDPRSGAPVAHAPAAVTVLADDALHADAWATALTVMGAEAGFEFAQARGIAARFVVRAGDQSAADVACHAGAVGGTAVRVHATDSFHAALAG
ncbi:FAD:protein FMN transferase [Luteimonas sp. MC1825]|uniref:FAD:protein FMN transferase n=1 Tax=Luteimonas sp. MC1825 TaxID=2761107 RepID=UPI001CC6ACE0|nr:FAD:protein FMN transferase [Luteimonas sp. MC1825]